MKVNPEGECRLDIFEQIVNTKGARFHWARTVKGSVGGSRALVVDGIGLHATEEDAQSHLEYIKGETAPNFEVQYLHEGDKYTNGNSTNGLIYVHKH